jgi:hypothetical protein
MIFSKEWDVVEAFEMGHLAMALVAVDGVVAMEDHHHHRSSSSMIGTVYLPAAPVVDMMTGRDDARELHHMIIGIVDAVTSCNVDHIAANALSTL